MPRLLLSCALAVAHFLSAGCNLVPVLLNGSRPPPAILPSGSGEQSLGMTFTVDLRDYPDAARLTWEFGDGGTTPGLPVSTGRTVIHEFPRAGIYNVQVYVFDGGNPIDARPPKQLGSGFLPVEVKGANKSPTARFQILSVKDGAGNDKPMTKRFNAGASRDLDGLISGYSWDFGDGGTGEGISVEHTFAVGGQYTVRLTVTDDRGGTGETMRALVMNGPPTARFSFNITDTTARTVSFDGSASSDPEGGVLQFSWSFGDGTANGTDRQVSHTYAAPGTFDVTLTVTDAAGETGTATQSINVAGTELFLASVSLDFGVVDTTVAGVRLSGQNFPSEGITVALRLRDDSITASSVNVVDAQTLDASFDLTGAALGDYDVVVAAPPQPEAVLSGAFRVGTHNRVRLETTMGDMVFELVEDAPITTANFIQYVQDRFYDGTIFHRVVPGFVVQGGGFLPGNVEPPGIRPAIQNEFSLTRSNVLATVAMAKLGNDPDSATSQFFINLADNSSNLDNQNGGFTVFARVVDGMSVAESIAAVPLNGEQPVTDVVVNRVRRE